MQARINISNRFDKYVNQEIFDEAMKSLAEDRASGKKPPFIGCGFLIFVVLFLSLALALCD